MADKRRRQEAIMHRADLIYPCPSIIYTKRRFLLNHIYPFFYSLLLAVKIKLKINF